MVSFDSVKTYILNHFYEIEREKKGENEKDKKNSVCGCCKKKQLFLYGTICFANNCVL